MERIRDSQHGTASLMFANSQRGYSVSFPEHSMAVVALQWLVSVRYSDQTKRTPGMFFIKQKLICRTE